MFTTSEIMLVINEQNAKSSCQKTIINPSLLPKITLGTKVGQPPTGTDMLYGLRRKLIVQNLLHFIKNKV
jgi:hypothetical protein